MRQKLNRKNCLSGAWPANQHCRSTVGQSSAGGFIKTNDAGRGLVLHSSIDRPARFQSVSVKAHSVYTPSWVVDSLDLAGPIRWALVEAATFRPIPPGVCRDGSMRLFEVFRSRNNVVPHIPISTLATRLPVGGAQSAAQSHFLARPVIILLAIFSDLLATGNCTDRHTTQFCVVSNKRQGIPIRALTRQLHQFFYQAELLSLTRFCTVCLSHPLDYNYGISLAWRLIFSKASLFICSFICE